VLKKDNKNRASKRTIPILIDRLYELLCEQPNKTGLILTSFPDLLFKQVNAACVKSGLPKVGVHGLRHSFASLAYHRGVPERIAMQMGGWSDIGTMHKIYTHIAQKDVDKYAGELKTFFQS
jgi:integrase